jgi:hypothetical protein
MSQKRGSGIHLHMSGVEGVEEEREQTLTGGVLPLSCYWLKATNAQGFGAGIPKERSEGW